MKVYFWNTYLRSPLALMTISKQRKEAVEMTFQIRYQFCFSSWDVYKCNL